MAIKDILVHLSGSENTDSVTAAAISLAQRHDAKIIGLYAGVGFDMPSYVIAQLPAEVLQTHQENLQSSVDDAISRFKAACDAAGVSCDTRTGNWRDPIEDVICMHGRYTDITIIGQPSDNGMGSREREISDNVVLRAGGPVLIVPKNAARKQMGDRILIAWDGRRHAARAVKDAMPLLEHADFVKVLAIDPKPGVGGLGDLPGADLAHYLATHGVTAEADHTQSGRIGVGETLLNEASDMGADIIVCGGYGHSRIGELLLGGVTNTLMEEMTVPVMMSH